MSDATNAAGPTFTLHQSRYVEELERVSGRLRGPICQIGSRAQIVDTKRLNWRQRLADKGFIGADLEPGDNVDVVFDVCGDREVIRNALAPMLAGRPLRGFICAHLLEHLRTPWTAADTMAALLAPGGQIFVQVPWVQAFHGFPDDYWRMSLSGVMALFEGLELVDAFWSGGSSDVAYRVFRNGRPDHSLAARQLEATVFQVLLPPDDNKSLLKSLKDKRAYLARGYMPATVINALLRKPPAKVSRAGAGEEGAELNDAVADDAGPVADVGARLDG